MQRDPIDLLIEKRDALRSQVDTMGNCTTPEAENLMHQLDEINMQIAFHRHNDKAVPKIYTNND